MELSLPEHFSVEEAASILGASKGLDERTRALIEKAFAAVKSAAAPKMCYVYLDEAQLAPLVQGKDLARHLKDCDGAVLFAVTLGGAVDALLRRTQLTDMAYAVIMDAAASVVAESAAEQAQQFLIAQTQEKGRYLTGRFSPGYGDSPLSLQTLFLKHLDAQRKIGLCATDTCLLTPRKSITAICGEASVPVKGALAGCATCALRETCQKRKEGNPCHGAV
ncbi:MAG TPA: methionine synthase [Candidatus Ruthenibacterium avium]|uniref:Methionine synthase n=1 Tax=Candidatus Ruthenibacterium avium TaxID=2838751 RepID=A0A9D2M2B8_9FIRM|nr:methionine synthase [Candidatus Ruthenibacterium avium]